MRILICGHQGYIGHSLTKVLLASGNKVIGVDNGDRKDNVLSVGSRSATGENCLSHENLVSLSIDISKDSDFEDLQKVFENFQPECVVNLAHCPSAPFSMISRKNANYALNNNIVGTNNLLWLIRKHASDSQYITIGTAGEYNHYANIDIEEGYFRFTHNGRLSEECIFPRRPGSIYHTSKVGSTYLIDFLSRTWNLKTTDVMQGIVFGLYDSIDENPTRFDSDECFGTVINRFCMQAVLGQPLTVYGSGEHKRAFISLRDSIQALELAITNPPESGRPRVWNQLSEWFSMNELADKVIKIAQQNGITASKTKIETPRTEQTTEHYYNFKTDNLKAVGFEAIRSVEQEIDYTIKTLLEIADEELLEILRANMEPKTKWK